MIYAAVLVRISNGF